MKKRSIKQLTILLILFTNILIIIISLAFYYLPSAYFWAFVMIAVIIFIVSIVFLVYTMILNPISYLIEQTKNASGFKTNNLKLIDISEIDQLINAINDMRDELIHSSDIVLKAIHMTATPVGIFLMDYDKETVFLSDNIFDMLNLDRLDNSNIYPMEQWNQIYSDLIDNKDLFSDNIYVYDRFEEEKKWIKLKYSIDKNNYFGVMIDLTEDYLRRKHLEYEREIDGLTRLLNRKSFLENVNILMQKGEVNFALMLVVELENLDNIMDTYGYEMSEICIKSVASIFYSLINQKNAVVARIAENQFAAYFYNYEDKNELSKDLKMFSDMLVRHVFIMPDGFKHNPKFRMGNACYPVQADSAEILIRYADYAMRSNKSDSITNINQFELMDYLKENKLLKKINVLEELITKNMFDYVFQPIVEVRTGEIYAYAVFMRSKLKELKSPMEIIQLAKIKNCMSTIERITLFNVLEWIKSNEYELANRKIFINSLPKQRLDDQDYDKLENKYKKYISMLVNEFVELDGSMDNSDLLAQKYKIESSISDYGTGYNNDALLIKSGAKYIKVSMTITKDIYKSKEKQLIFEDIVGLGKYMNVKIIAVGVECYEDLKCLVQLGADYVQGYYIKEADYALPKISDHIKDILRELYLT